MSESNKTNSSRQWTIRHTIVAVITFFIVLALLLVIMENRFNASEIKMLVDNANARGISYRLTIHNEWLNTFSFTPLDAQEGCTCPS